MKLLLDTNALIWWFEDPALLTSESRKAIRNGENSVYVSAAAVWEISIKKSLGKLQAPDDIDVQIMKENFIPLPIAITHALAVGNLPPYHQDPFDRIQIVQAKLEKLTIVTRDKNIKRYDVPVIIA